MKRLKEETDPSIVHIDLRGSIFRDVSSFSAALIQELGSWHKRLNRLKLLPHVKGKLSVSTDKNLRGSVRGNVGRRKGIGHGILSKTEDAIQHSKTLPDWNWLRGLGIPSPVLVIDEANRIRALLDDERGSAALNDFFAWIVQNTSRFHVMMASSDSFFLRWITQYVDSAYFRNFVIGHLSKDEAKRYWEEKVTQEVMQRDDIPPLKCMKFVGVACTCFPKHT